MTGPRRFLGPDDPVGSRDRVLVCGVSGVGKSTLCGVLSRRWNLPYTELDSLYHGPNWTALASFHDDVAAIAAAPRWVSEQQYLSNDGVGHVLAARAGLLLWLDWPRRIALPRLLRRTLARSISRRELWNGNRERPIWRLFGGDESDNILRWERATHDTWRRQLADEVRSRHPHLEIVRFRRPRELRRWLAVHAPAERDEPARPGIPD